MLFRIQTSDHAVKITAEQLAQLLVQQSIKPTRPWASASPILADELTRMLEDQNVLRSMNLRELTTIAIDVGYYLNTFLRKNDVQLEEQDVNTSPFDEVND